MASLGFNGDDGTLLTGFDHVRQSIGIILNTPIGSRVMRREFGSDLINMIDRPMTDQVILAIYSATVMALTRWEPRFTISHVNIADVNPSGTIRLELLGTYYPRGHLGDFSLAQSDTNTSVSIMRAT